MIILTMRTNQLHFYWVYKVCKVYKNEKKYKQVWKNICLDVFASYCFFFFFFLSFEGQGILFKFWYFWFKQKQSLLSLIFCEPSNSYVFCECIVWCVMCGVPDLNFVRSWLFESMGDLKCTIVCCFSRPPMTLMVNGSCSIRRDNHSKI